MNKLAAIFLGLTLSPLSFGAYKLGTTEYNCTGELNSTYIDVEKRNPADAYFSVDADSLDASVVVTVLDQADEGRKLVDVSINAKSIDYTDSIRLSNSSQREAQFSSTTNSISAKYSHNKYYSDRSYNSFTSIDLRYSDKLHIEALKHENEINGGKSTQLLTKYNFVCDEVSK